MAKTSTISTIVKEHRRAATLQRKALADPNRLEIFRLIAAQNDPLCVCDIVDRFSLTQPTISHHLKILREAGLIEAERRGTWAYYRLNRNAVGEVALALSP